MTRPRSAYATYSSMTSSPLREQILLSDGVRYAPAYPKIVADCSFERSSFLVFRHIASAAGAGVVVAGGWNRSYARCHGSTIIGTEVSLGGTGETRAVTEWEYRKIDLNQQRPRSDELDM